MIKPAKPTKPSRKPHPLAAICRQIRASNQKRELERTDIPVWTINAVALVLRCNVDLVYRIPRSELPYAKPGKRNLFLPDDVISYVRSLRDKQGGVKLDLSARVSQIDSLADSTRGRSVKRSAK